MGIDNERDMVSYNALCRDAVYGMAVGDALGVPADGYSRRDLIRRPVLTMQEYGVHNRVQKGTWTYPTSFALATADSIANKNGIDLDDMMANYISNATYGKYAIDHKTSWLENSIEESLTAYKYRKKNAKYCGTETEDCGVLSRVLPACMYEIKNANSDRDAIRSIEDVCGLTNANHTSKVACGIYYFILKETVFSRQETLEDRVSTPFLKLLQRGIDEARYYYHSTVKDVDSRKALNQFTLDLEVLERKPANQMTADGTVAGEMTTVLWALCNGKTYEDTLLKLVNFGDHASCRCAFAGGVAGLYYGFRGIPHRWKDVLRNQDTLNGYIKKM